MVEPVDMKVIISMINYTNEKLVRIRRLIL